MEFRFNREADSNLIVLPVLINQRYRLKMILDTGASFTTIDSNMLYLFGYSTKDSLEKVQVETANGIIETDIFELASLEAFGVKKDKYQIQAYDFLAQGIISDYNGLLGLDFFDNHKLCINFKKNVLSLQHL
jgi:gag-polyprotein putative aspartyl protease